MYMAHQIIRNMVKVASSLLFFFSFIAVGCSADRLARLDVRHYHLDAAETTGDGEDAGLSYSNRMLFL